MTTRIGWHLLEIHAHLLGAVLNDVPLQRQSYYYRHYKYSYDYYPDHEKPESSGKPRQVRRLPGFMNGWLSRFSGKFRREV